MYSGLCNTEKRDYDNRKAATKNEQSITDFIKTRNRLYIHTIRHILYTFPILHLNLSKVTVYHYRALYSRDRSND